MLVWTIVLSTLATGLLVAPIARFLQTGWLNKFNDIRNNFDVDTIKIYFEQYRSKYVVKNSKTKLHELNADTENNKKLILAEFENIYKNDLTKYYYAIPIFLLVVISAAEAVAVIQTALIYIDLGIYAASFQDSAKILTLYGERLSEKRLHALCPALVIDAPTSAAMVGAYLWVVQDTIRRMRSGDMLPSDLYWSALRLSVSAPLGLAAASFAGGSPGVAFALGAFPIEQLQRILRAIAARLLNVTNDPDTDGDEVKKLVGVNNDIAHRLIVEDTSSVLALAKVDPVWLAMRTNLRFEVVTDLMEQAVVWMNVACAKPEDTAVKMEKLRGSGLDTATGVAQFMKVYNAIEGDRRAELDKLMEATAASFPSVTGAGQPYSKAQLLEVLKQIADDQVTLFLMNLKSAAR